MNSLLHAMRSFTIRLRMTGAIAVVLILLVLVGGSALWGMVQMQGYNRSLLDHSVTQITAMGQLELTFAQLRRSEAELVIHHAQPEAVRTAKSQWDQALARSNDLLTQMQKEEASATSLRAVQEELGNYGKVVNQAASGLSAGSFASVDAAFAALQPARALFDAIDTRVGKINQEVDAQVQSTASAAEKAQSTIMWAFGFALAMAALIVVPTTLANMHSICAPLEQAQGLAVSIARGDLTTQPDLTGRDELTELMRCLVDMQGALSRTVGEVREAADHIHIASVEIANGNHDLSARTEQTASHLQETASSMDQITVTVRQSADAAQSAIGMAQNNADVAQRGGAVVGQVVSTMDEINQSSQKIHDIISVIDGIAFQTNILALNAAVEAARAGEAGRGFAVVAGEVRSLAQRSAEAAREIKGLIETSVEKVTNGTQLVHQAGGTIGEIVENARKLSAFIAEITTATTEQSQGIAGVNTAVTDLDQMTQQNAALVEQSAAAAENLREQAQRLTNLVSVFRLSGGQPGHAPLMPAATRGHGVGSAPYTGPERRSRPRT